VKTEEILFLLLRSELRGGELTEAEKAALREHCDIAQQRALFSLSGQHDMVHLVGAALLRHGLLPNEGGPREKYENQQLHAVYRYENAQHELSRIGELFTSQKIDYIPLKGAKISRFYPEPWMRTSTDIDILVREGDLERALSLLTEKLGYTADERRQYHDVTLLSPNRVHVELHFSLQEPMERMNGVLSRVWDHAAPVFGGSHEYAMQPAFFLFHQIAHAAYHFAKGGCGIRPVADVYLLQNALTYDGEELSRYLSESGLSVFADGLFALSRVWFGGEVHTPLTEKMEAYILRAGSFGLLDNRVAVEQLESGGSGKHLRRRIFMPYRELCSYYEGLARRPWLTPFYQVRRWCRILFGKNRAWAMQELKYNTMPNKAVASAAQLLCRELDLV